MAKFNGYDENGDEILSKYAGSRRDDDEDEDDEDEDDDADEFLLEDDDDAEGEGMADDDVHQPYQFEAREVGTDMAKVYDEHKRLFLVVDKSGSMDAGMLESYGPGMLAPRDYDAEVVQNMYAQYTIALQDKLFWSCETPSTPLSSMVDAFVKAHGSKGLEEIKTELNQHIDVGFYLGVPIKDQYRTKLATKMDTLKKLAVKAAEDRYAKYPNAKLTVVAFDGETKFQDCATLQEAKTFINKLKADGGNTDIVLALRSVAASCAKAPSAVNLHHVVLVTDGEDALIADAEKMVTDLMLEQGMVLDIVTILGDYEVLCELRNRSTGSSEAKDALNRICRATGGTSEVARDSKNFEQRFLGAAQRLCLPAPKA